MPEQHEEQAHNSGEDTNTISVTSTIIPKNKAKWMKVECDFTPEDENTMVDCLELHPVLYNKKLVSYKDTAKKEWLWTDKVAEMEKEVVMLKTCYTSLRTNFVH